MTWPDLIEDSNSINNNFDHLTYPNSEVLNFRIESDFVYPD